MSLFALAMSKQRSFAIEIIELLNLEDVHDELSSEQNQTVRLFTQKLRAIENGDFQDGFDMFDKLCGVPGLSSQAKGYALAYRGESYHLMKRYEAAVADFDRAIALDEKYAWAIVRRGQTYRQMERYEEALADFDRAIALDEKDSWAIGNRGEVYLLTGLYAEALTDFERVITINEKSDWYRYCRALIYMITSQTSASENNIQAAIKLAQISFDNKPDNWLIGFNLALYNLVFGNMSDANEQYAKLITTCQSLPRLQAAVNDLTDYLKLQPSNELAQSIRSQLQTRIEELKQSRTV